MYKEQILHTLSNSKELLKQQYHIVKIGLFGSYSQNTQHVGSDIDLVIELADGKRLGLKEVYELEQYLKKTLHTERIDIVHQKYMNPIIESEMVKSVVFI